MAAERGEGAPLTLTYRALRGVFTAGLKGFYNTVEVRIKISISDCFVTEFAKHPPSSTPPHQPSGLSACAADATVAAVP